MRLPVTDHSRSSADPTKKEELLRCGLVAFPRAAIFYANLDFPRRMLPLGAEQVLRLWRTNLVPKFTVTWEFGEIFGVMT
jgi:hypothetical protein